MVFVLVSEAGKILHVERKLRPLTEQEKTDKSAIFTWPDSLGDIHIGGTVTIEDDEISAHAGHDLDTLGNAEKVAQARYQLQVAYNEVVWGLTGGALRNALPGATGNGVTIAQLYARQWLAYGYRSCKGVVADIDGDDALTAVGNVREALLPTPPSGGGIPAFAVALSQTNPATLRTSFTGYHDNRQLWVWVPGGTNRQVATVSATDWTNIEVNNAMAAISNANWNPE